jgi:ketosteroid isomerase-like protein
VDLAARLTELLLLPPIPFSERKTMHSATTPEQLARNFVQAFNHGDLETILSLFEPDALLAPQPGQTVSGADGLRGALAGFLGLNASFDLTLRRVLSTGDMALIIGDWRLAEAGLAGTTADVAHRDAAGVWRYVIDNPFGTL